MGGGKVLNYVYLCRGNYALLVRLESSCGISAENWNLIIRKKTVKT